MNLKIQKKTIQNETEKKTETKQRIKELAMGQHRKADIYVCVCIHIYENRVPEGDMFTLLFCCQL